MLVPFDSREFNDVLPRRVAIIGSTGSIGKTALDIIRRNPDKFSVDVLAAGSNVELLAEQAREFEPKLICIADPTRLEELRARTRHGNSHSNCELLSGPEGIAEAVSRDSVDVVLAAVVGMAGLEGVLHALKADKIVALANKESLVAGGELVKKALAQSKGCILPVDSEHSAIFQCLQVQDRAALSKIILTASGGPFLDTPKNLFRSIKPEQALKHPRWQMGAKITIDSATLMNKALEVIEAHWLFGLPGEKIKVVIHPQSIIHSMIEFRDNALLAQLSVPDMAGPIAYAIGYPHGRVPATMEPLDFDSISALEFRKVDTDRFPSIYLAYDALRSGGAASSILNAANELAVGAFLNHKIAFDRIFSINEEALGEFKGVSYSSISDLHDIYGEIKNWFNKSIDQK